MKIKFRTHNIYIYIYILGRHLISFNILWSYFSIIQYKTWDGGYKIKMFRSLFSSFFRIFKILFISRCCCSIAVKTPVKYECNLMDLNFPNKLANTQCFSYPYSKYGVFCYFGSKPDLYLNYSAVCCMWSMCKSYCIVKGLTNRMDCISTQELVKIKCVIIWIEYIKFPRNMQGQAFTSLS